MAVALSAGVFAPRTVDAEEMPDELSVRVENPAATLEKMGGFAETTGLAD
jgi:hypothetical protein